MRTVKLKALKSTSLLLSIQIRSTARKGGTHFPQQVWSKNSTQDIANAWCKASTSQACIHRWQESWARMCLLSFDKHTLSTLMRSMKDDSEPLEVQVQKALKNSKDSFFLAITSSNVHPTWFTSFAVGGCHFVINRWNTFCTECINISERTLIITLSFRYFFLGMSWRTNNKTDANENPGEPFHPYLFNCAKKLLHIWWWG